MSKLCQNWQKWQWPIWCISSRWRERGQALFAFQKYLLLCTFQDKDLLPFKAKQIFVENQGILTDDQHVASRIGTNEWQLVTHCQVLIPKKGWQRNHLTSTYGIPAWRWEVPPNNFGRIPCASPPCLCSSPLKGSDLTAPPEQPGSRLGRFWATGHLHIFWRNHYSRKYFFALL